MTTETAPRMGTFAAIKRAVVESPIIARRLWVVLVLNLGGTAVAILTPILVQITLDRYISGEGSVDIGGVTTLVGMGLGVAVVGGWMMRTGLVRLVRQASTGMSELRVLTFRHLFRRSVLHVQTERRGSLVSRVT